MKLWYNPVVYVIAQTKADYFEMERFVQEHGYNVSNVLGPMQEQAMGTDGGDMLVEFAGRMCYMSFDKGRPSSEYIKHILEVGHGSVLEHTNITLAFTGISRTLTHELVRHRAGFAYSQLSQRFVNEENVGFVVPPLLIGKEEQIKYWSDGIKQALELYKDFVQIKMKELSTTDSMIAFANRAGLLEASGSTDQSGKELFHLCGHYNNMEQLKQIFETDESARKNLKKATFSARKKTALEASRSVLPNCTETKITTTANGRAWRHFLNMRGSIHADREIRRLACVVADKLKEVAPLLFQDVEVLTNPGDGLPYVRVGHKKV